MVDNTSYLGGRGPESMQNIATERNVPWSDGNLLGVTVICSSMTGAKMAPGMVARQINTSGKLTINDVTVV